MRARIIGTGSSVPGKVVTNADLEKLVDTSDEWIVTRTGIRQRHIAEAGEYTSTFATRAVMNALENAGVSPSSVDIIIIATVTPDFPFPATACLVQDQLKASNAAAFDISAACSGFLYGLALVDGLIRSGAIKRAVVAGAEVLSRIVDWTDRNTCCLFGDGAGAVVIEATEGESGILSTHIHSDGTYWELLNQRACGSRHPATQETIDQKLAFLTMQGNEVFKLAVRAMEDAAYEALSANRMGREDIDLFIPHQANRRIIDAIAKRLGVTESQVYVNLDRYGNTSAASIPIALDEANQRGLIEEGNILLFDAFGGGLTWGSALVRW